MASRRFARVAVLLGLALVAVAAFVAFRLVTGWSENPVPPIAKPSFAFGVIGDFGTGTEAERAVARRIEAWNDADALDALVTTGDNVYPSGDPRFFERAWEQPYGWVESTGVEMIASLGNHDFAFEGGDEVVELFRMPHYWYRRTIGDADLFVLDSNRIGDPQQDAWLAAQLTRSNAVWRIVVFHHPAFSCSEHGSTQTVIDRWVPLFENGGVDLVLNGHDHNYQHFEGSDVTYLVTGGGGAAFYELEDCGFDSPTRVQEDAEKNHFLVVEGNDARLRIRAISEQGEMLDDFELEAD